MIKKLLLLILTLPALTALSQQRNDFANLISLQPGTDGLKDGYLFSDLGTWHGFGLSDSLNLSNAGALRGPAIIKGRKGITWIADAFVNFSPTHLNGTAVAYTKINQTTYFPGMLVMSSSAREFDLKIKHIAVGPKTTMTVFYVTNTGDKDFPFIPRWKGSLNDMTVLLSNNSKNQLQLDIDKGKRAILLYFSNGVSKVSGDAGSYLAEGSSITLKKGKTISFSVFCTYSPDAGLQTALTKQAGLKKFSTETEMVSNEKRWNGYIKNILDPKTSYLKEKRFQNWAVKSLMTLMTNWRSAAGDLKHDGVVPATNRFDAFWAWDSWEHAAALSIFNPWLAKQQMLVMFDEQTPEGMVIDLLSIDKKENNKACSKPPIASWGTYMVYQRTKDAEFLKEMYPKLIKFHQWRFKYRDHDQNGLCEYGGIGDKIHFGQWESGMDVAVKFHGAKMLNNSPGAYSLDQESVELNSYLCAEKFYLSYFAGILGKKEEAKLFKEEGLRMRKQIQNLFFDSESGFFYDRKLKSGELVKIIDISGWIPLFTGVATPLQAEKVKNNMLDPELFGTYFPFSTLNHKHRLYNPDKGYFRGQTWMNYTYFGIRGFKNYGFNQAEKLVWEIPDKFKGIADPGFAIRESYSSADGHGLDASHFSWSSAFSLLLLTEDAERFPYLIHEVKQDKI